MKSRFLKSLKILLVEDEKSLSQLLYRAIGDDFHSFTMLSNGKDALQEYIKNPPDIVITDIMMPKMTGLELAQEIRKINPNTPVIILSAYSDTDKLLSAIDMGIVKYFIKPFDPEEVLEYISSLKERFQEYLLELCEEFTYSYEKKSLYKKGRYVFLSKNESLFLELLLYKGDEKSHGIVSNDVIQKALWGSNGNENRLRTFVKRFRTKTVKKLLKNIKNEGYYICTQP